MNIQGHNSSVQTPTTRATFQFCRWSVGAMVLPLLAICILQTGCSRFLSPGVRWDETTDALARPFEGQFSSLDDFDFAAEEIDSRFAEKTSAKKIAELADQSSTQWDSSLTETTSDAQTAGGDFSTSDLPAVQPAVALAEAVAESITQPTSEPVVDSQSTPSIPDFVTDQDFSAIVEKKVRDTPLPTETFDIPNVSAKLLIPDSQLETPDVNTTDQNHMLVPMMIPHNVPGIARQASSNQSTELATELITNSTAPAAKSDFVESANMPAIISLEPEDRDIIILKAQQSLPNTADDSLINPLLPNPTAPALPQIKSQPIRVAQSNPSPLLPNGPAIDSTHISPLCECGECDHCRAIETVIAESDRIVEELANKTNIESMPPFVAVPALSMTATEPANQPATELTNELVIDLPEPELTAALTESSIAPMGKTDRGDFQPNVASRLQAFEPEEKIVEAATVSADVAVTKTESKDWMPPSVEKTKLTTMESEVAPVTPIPQPKTMTPPWVDDVETSASRTTTDSTQLVPDPINDVVTLPMQLSATIDAVRRELENGSDKESGTLAADHVGLKVNLRLLEMLERQLEFDDYDQTTLKYAADFGNAQMNGDEKRYWTHQLSALATMLEPASAQSNSDISRHRTAVETLDHLREAVKDLEQMANLRLNSATFCTDIEGYGQIKRADVSQLNPGQRLLIYTEVENFISKKSLDNQGTPIFQTHLRGSFVVYDSEGRAVQQAEFPVLVDQAMKLRRDFYMHMPVTVGQLKPGTYKLHLMVEDLGGNKSAGLDPPLEFTVR